MSEILDYAARVEALRKAKAGATATVQKIVHPTAPLQKQAAPERSSAVWKRLLAEATVKFHTGLAPDMPTALGMVAKEMPQLYEQYRAEQVAACGAPVAKSVPPPPAPAPDANVAQFETLVAKAMAAAPGITRTTAMGRVLASPEGEALAKQYYAGHPQHRVRH